MKVNGEEQQQCLAGGDANRKTGMACDLVGEDLGLGGEQSDRNVRGANCFARLQNVSQMPFLWGSEYEI